MRKKLLPILAIILCLGLVLGSVIVLASTKYENYITGDDADTEAYGVNWYSQTFTTTSAHTVNQVRVELYRTGLPGTTTLSIRSVNADSGHPIGTDWTSGTLNGSTFTDSSPGSFYTFDITEYSLANDTKYAIILRAVGGDASNKVHWRYNSAGSYSSGNYELSTNSGSTWTANTSRDFMFEVYGEESLEIIGANVFSSVVDDGDWYFTVHYKNIVPPEYPAEDPGIYYYIQLLDTNGSTVLAQRPLPAWGYKPASLGLSASEVARRSLTWGDDYFIRIIGNPDMFGSPSSETYALTGTDWIGAELWWLDEWVISTAQDMETYYSENMTVSSIGDEVLDSPILNFLGGKIFLEGMPGLSEIRPDLFWVIVYGPEWDEEEYEDTFTEEHNWVDMLGGSEAQIPTALNATGDVFGVSGRMIGGLGIFITCLAMVGVLVSKGTVGILPAIILGFLGIAAGAQTGLIEYALIAVLGCIVIVLFVKVFWWRET